MLVRTQSATATSKNAASKKVAAKTTFTMQRLWRQALWGSIAAAALLVAIVAGRTDIGSQRAAVVLSSLNLPAAASVRPGQGGAQVATQPAPRSPELESAIRQLVQAVRGLGEDRDRIMTRLVAVEHNVDDMTGSISRQIEEAKAAATKAPAPWPSAEAPPVPTAPTTIALLAASAAPPPAPAVASPSAPAIASPPPPAPAAQAAAAPAAAQSPPDTHVSDQPSAAYGADLGGASSIKALHARWLTIRSAHAEMFDGLTSVAAVRENPRSSAISLRLVVGPFANAEQAAELCASLAAVQLSCQPTMFDGPHLALQ